MDEGRERQNPKSLSGLCFRTHKMEVQASRGVVAANHPLASAAGVEMFAIGGNAFDAAIASPFALTVVEPMMVGVFGAGFFVARAMDSEGNIVAATQTLFSPFGSKAMTPGTGVLLNNCMGLFDPRPGRANSVAGGKRMLSSMAPAIVLRNGEPSMCLGAPGWTRIFAAVCQAVINIIDFGMTIQQAVEAPRIWTMGIPGTDGEKLHVEPGFSEETLDKLRAKGHKVIEMPKIAGGMNGILVDSATGLMHGGAFWRADGTSIGISGGPAHPRALLSPPPF